MPKKKKNLLTRKLIGLSNFGLKGKIFIMIASALVIAGIGTAILSLGSAEAVPSGAYSNYTWSTPAGGFGALQHELMIEALDGNPTYFWAHQFHVVNGDGGYIGLQSHGGRVNGTVGKTAVFSMFSSGISGTPAGNCKVQQSGFDGYNTSGTSCRIPYEWVIGHKYQLTVLRGATTAQGTIWGGWIKDQNTGVDTNIASITVPKTWQGINNVTSQWTEYFGPRPANCTDYPVSRVRFYKPRTYLPPSSPVALDNNPNHVSGVCRNSQIEDFGDSVVQQIGGFTNMAAPAKNSTPTTPTAQHSPPK